MDNQCCEIVTDSTGWHRNHCNRKPYIEVGGKTYCAIHNPAKVKERQEKSEAKYKSKCCPNCGWGLKKYWSYCPGCGKKNTTYKL